MKLEARSCSVSDIKTAAKLSFLTLKTSKLPQQTETRRMLSHLVKDGFDVDRQVSMRAAKTSHDAETKTRGASL